MRISSFLFVLSSSAKRTRLIVICIAEKERKKARKVDQLKPLKVFNVMATPQHKMIISASVLSLLSIAVFNSVYLPYYRLRFNPLLYLYGNIHPAIIYFPYTCSDLSRTDRSHVPKSVEEGGGGSRGSMWGNIEKNRGK